MSTKKHGLWAAVALTVALISGTAAPAAATTASKVDDSPTKVDTSTITIGAAAPTGAAGMAYVARSKAAGLSTAQANALQAKADRYLAAFGKGATQAGPDKIALTGATLYLTVPGEAHPRGLSSAEDAQILAGCPYYYFCAYQYNGYTGEQINLERCGEARIIPWYTTGSWINNQTRGTQPLATFTSSSGTPPWRMPGAYAEAWGGVDWSPVLTIKPC